MDCVLIATRAIISTVSTPESLYLVTQNIISSRLSRYRFSRLTTPATLSHTNYTQNPFQKSASTPYLTSTTSEQVQSMLKQRILYVTQNDLPVLGPPVPLGTIPNQEGMHRSEKAFRSLSVAFLCGCDVPFLLGAQHDDDGTAGFQLLGEAFVHGYMHGEVLEMLENAHPRCRSLKLQDITLLARPHQPFWETAPKETDASLETPHSLSLLELWRRRLPTTP